MAFYGIENDRYGLTEFYHRLRRAWCIDSCSPSLRDQWSEDKPMLGQCFVTAVLVRERFGGDIYETRFADGSIHYFNRVDGMVFDLTSEQFGGAVKPSVYAAGIPTDIAKRLSDPIKSDRRAALIAALEDL